MSAAPGVLRARAVLVLAAHQELDKHAIARLFDELSVAAKPDAAAALALVSTADDEVVAAVTQEDPLLAWVYQYASDHPNELS